MTNQVLQSDIDLARRLLTAGRPDEDILGALVCRNIAPDRAIQLVTDLRQGLRVEPDLPEMGALRRPGPKPGSGSVTHRDWRPDAPDYSARQPRRNLPWFMTTLLVALAICAGTVIFSNHRTHAKLRAAPVAESAAEELKALARTAATPGSISLELRSDGLHLGVRLLSRANALTLLTDAFGPPSRTNLVEGSGKVIYAYDQQGMVVHCQNEKQNDCLVLYFDAIGGDNGARQPFSGTLRVAGHKIQGSTDPTTLASFKELGLTEPGTNSVLEARCHGVPVSFAYLESPTRLSLVEIDLK
jgi:hypothetical protein